MCADYGAVPAACALNGSRFMGREVMVATSTPLNKDLGGDRAQGRVLCVLVVGLKLGFWGLNGFSQSVGWRHQPHSTKTWGGVTGRNVGFWVLCVLGFS